MFAPITNTQRASWAQSALATFQQATRTDDCDAIADLICDLMHLARQQGVDPLKLVMRAELSFLAEIQEDNSNV